MEWMRQTVLVTGAGGFIGSHLVERLVALGARTRAFIRHHSRGSPGWLDASPAKEDIEIFLGDIRDRDSIREAMRGVDVVFHLAALRSIPHSHLSPVSCVQTNVEGTVNVLQTARELQAKRVILASTSEVYGHARYVPMDESHPLKALSPDSAGKIAAEKMAEAFYESFGLPVTTLRLFSTFGPRQHAKDLIPTIITEALAGGPVYLCNLAPTRDLTYVEDMVEGFLRSAQVPEAVGKTINLGVGKEISLGLLADIVLHLMETDVPVMCDEFRASPGEASVDRVCADITLARDILKWSPVVGLREGLEWTIDWVMANKDRLLPSQAEE